MKKYAYLGMLMALVLMTSCINTKKMVVLENMKDTGYYPIDSLLEIKIQRDDRLSILVTSKKTELALPFNMLGGTLQISSGGEVTKASSNSSQRVQQLGYLVDIDGSIMFPILGKLEVSGLTRKEVAELIQKRLIDEGYISDPVVYVELQNLRVTIMGEVHSQGVLDVTNARITILEAITRANGMTSNADLKNVSVIREENNERKMYTLDVRSTDILNSPCYYLQQNDIVYVHPKYARSTVKEDRTLQFYSLLTGLISFIASMAVLIYK